MLLLGISVSLLFLSIVLTWTMAKIMNVDG